jgi:hypothetical protein
MSCLWGFPPWTFCGSWWSGCSPRTWTRSFCRWTSTWYTECLWAPRCSYWWLFSPWFRSAVLSDAPSSSAQPFRLATSFIAVMNGWILFLCVLSFLTNCRDYSCSIDSNTNYFYSDSYCVCYSYLNCFLYYLFHYILLNHFD